ncbi:MAG: hypothetical protein WCI75_17480, partial [candidate division NC10 bacterium]
ASRIRAVLDASEQAARAGDPQDAARLAGKGFDGAAQSQGFVSPPPVPELEHGEKRPTANLIIGDPGRATLREPRNPLTKEGKPGRQRSGHGGMWALGGAAVLGLAGFLLGGPIGAAIGAVLGAALGGFLGP